MGILRNLLRLIPAARTPQGRSHTTRQHQPVLEFARLEERALMSFIAAPPTVSQQVLAPTNRYVPITVSGQFTEYRVVTVNDKPSIVFGAQPGPRRANFQVVDQYRQDQPRGPITLHLTNAAGGVFQYSFTFFLQASRKNSDLGGRQYHVIVAAGDKDGWTGKIFTVLVPHSLSTTTMPKTTTTTPAA